MVYKLYTSTYTCEHTFFVCLIYSAKVIQILYEYSVLDHIIHTRAGSFQDGHQVLQGHLRLLRNAARHQLQRGFVQA